MLFNIILQQAHLTALSHGQQQHHHHQHQHQRQTPHLQDGLKWEERERERKMPNERLKCEIYVFIRRV